MNRFTTPRAPRAALFALLVGLAVCFASTALADPDARQNIGPQWRTEHLDFRTHTTNGTQYDQLNAPYIDSIQVAAPAGAYADTSRPVSTKKWFYTNSVRDTAHWGWGRITYVLSSPSIGMAEGDSTVFRFQTSAQGSIWFNQPGNWTAFPYGDDVTSATLLTRTNNATYLVVPTVSDTVGSKCIYTSFIKCPPALRLWPFVRVIVTTQGNAVGHAASDLYFTYPEIGRSTGGYQAPHMVMNTLKWRRHATAATEGNDGAPYTDSLACVRSTTQGNMLTNADTTTAFDTGNLIPPFQLVAGDSVAAPVMRVFFTDAGRGVSSATMTTADSLNVQFDGSNDGGATWFVAAPPILTNMSQVASVGWFSMTAPSTHYAATQQTAIGPCYMVSIGPTYYQFLQGWSQIRMRAAWGSASARKFDKVAKVAYLSTVEGPN